LSQFPPARRTAQAQNQHLLPVKFELSFEREHKGMEIGLLILILLFNAFALVVYRSACDAYDNENAESWADTYRILDDHPSSLVRSVKRRGGNRLVYTVHPGRSNKTAEFDLEGRRLDPRPSLTSHLAFANISSIVAFLIAQARP
jgi:hypothetical protein